MPRTARLAGIALFAGFVLAASTFAQDNGGQARPTLQPGRTADAPSGQPPADSATPGPSPADLKEQADYKELYDAPDSNPDAKIQLANAFLVNYPDTTHKEAVYTQLLHAYFAKQDWMNFYSAGDKVLAVDPDDVDALTLVGWVIPRAFQPSDPDAQFQLAKAETYEKHALDVLESIPKPDTLTDAQFSDAKALAIQQAHSGLGLTYFREQKPADSVTELQKATSNTATPDATDFFILGVELAQLDRASDAIDAFAKCSAIPGSLQDQCKERGDAVKKQPVALH